MKILLAIAAMTLAASAEARSVDICPELPQGSTLAWQYREGPDFDLCYANPPGSDDTAFGIYFGNHPSFDGTPELRAEKGRVFGKRVRWHRSQDSSPHFRETTVPLDRKSGYVAHIWVNATSQPQLQELLSVVQRLQFKR